MHGTQSQRFLKNWIKSERKGYFKAKRREKRNRNDMCHPKPLQTARKATVDRKGCESQFKAQCVNAYVQNGSTCAASKQARGAQKRAGHTDYRLLQFQ